MELGYRLGEYLRSSRLARGIGLRAAARAAGISPGHLSRMESDPVSAAPSEDVLRRLAGVLEEDPDYLVCLAGRVPADVLEVATRYPMPSVMRRMAERGVSPEMVLAWVESQPRARRKL